jgi:antitoxin HicB
MATTFAYRCALEPNGQGGLLGVFPDLPECVTEGADRADALANAADALAVALLGRLADGEDLPRAAARAGIVVRPEPLAAAKIAVISAFRESGLTKVALAEHLGKGETEVRRILDPRHATKLQALQTALAALGHPLMVVAGSSHL